MLRYVPIQRLKQHLVLIIVTLFVIFPFRTIIYHQQHMIYKHVTPTFSNKTRYERYCDEFYRHIRAEQISDTLIKIDSTIENIPYSYSRWRSTPLLPRPLTQCEHTIYMDLLSILVKQVFKKYNIPYMMIAATLLGSYTHHDILPWDDDVDLRVPITNRSRLQSIIRKELSSKPYSMLIVQIHNARNYDKVFFSWCPHAGKLPWRFPFIDIFYHDQNSTHVWLLGKPSSCPVRLENVFPMVLRPLGSLWLNAPREPMAVFESRRMKPSGCFVFPYSHKHERAMRTKTLFAACTKLKSFYPYVERQCVSNRCVEYLMLGNNTIIHSTIYNHAYRTFLYTEKNSSYKAC